MPAVNNPLTESLKWFNSISPNCQSDIALFVLTSAMEDFELSAAVPACQAWLSEQDLHPLVIVGRAGMFKTVISSCLTRPRSRPEIWAEVAALNAVVAAKAKVAGNADLAELLSYANKNSPAQQADWHEAITTWNTLIEGTLSEGSLENWFKAAMNT